MAKKLSAIRQLSLQCETPTTPPSRCSAKGKRLNLRKQLSEEICSGSSLCDDNDENKQRLGIRISLSAKSRSNNTRNPNVKLAWGENCQEHQCKETSEITPETPEIKQVEESDQRDENVLYSRQDLAQKLRQAYWRDREKSKKSLRIFLGQSNNNKEQNRNLEGEGNLRNPQGNIHHEVPTSTTNKDPPKITLPLQPDLQTADFKNIFQRNLKKERNLTNKSPRLPTPCNYVPSRCVQQPISSVSTTIMRGKEQSFNNFNTIVVVPVMERSNQIIKPPKCSSNDVIKDDNTTNTTNTTNDVKNLPENNNNKIVNNNSSISASMRRELFQKRANSAFNGTIVNNRPPLIKSSSTPTPKTSKFLTATTSKRKNKVKVPSKRKNPQLKEGKEEELVEQRKCTDIVTMVSLVSASESEHEDAEPEVNNKTTEKKFNVIEPNNNKSFSLRKTVKQVSFQQSSIHAVRSFSASFPSRRTSMATALLLGGAAKKLQKGLTLEKRGQDDTTIRDEQSGPKRRFVRSITIATTNDTATTEKDKDDDGEGKSHQTEVSMSASDRNSSADRQTTQPKAMEDQQEVHSQQMKDESRQEKQEVKNELEEQESAKERECWTTYRKMSERGVNVSYETILRGMLTPTEYRLRRKLSLQESPIAD